MTRLTLLLAVWLLQSAPRELPATAVEQLAKSLAASQAHASHVWLRTPPMERELVNAYIEIPLGETRKYEFDMAANARKIDRVMPASVGGYPVNYGFVPQTVSYDGDPFDVLVLGPALTGGQLYKGIAVGLMQMEDEKGLDSKVVVSRVGADGKPLHTLTAADRDRMAAFFRIYKEKDEDPKTFARVPGWGSAAEGLAFVRTTNEFFLSCRSTVGTCRLP